MINDADEKNHTAHVLYFSEAAPSRTQVPYASTPYCKQVGEALASAAPPLGTDDA